MGQLWSRVGRHGITYYGLCQVAAVPAGTVAPTTVRTHRVFEPARGQPIKQTLFFIHDAATDVDRLSVDLAKLAAETSTRIIAYEYPHFGTLRHVPGYPYPPAPDVLLADVLNVFDATIDNDGPPCLLMGVGIGSALAFHVLCNRPARVADAGLINAFGALRQVVDTLTADSWSLWLFLWFEPRYFNNLQTLAATTKGARSLYKGTLRFVHSPQNTLFTPHHSMTLFGACDMAWPDADVKYPVTRDWDVTTPWTTMQEEFVKEWVVS